MREPEFIAQFQRDIATHKLYVERDDGLYRHLRFRATDAEGRTSYNMGFDIVTWPGWLAYTGDMGSFVFARLPDMLNFFRKAPRQDGTIFDGIDRRYWAEKCEAQGTRGDGIREFDAEAFKAEIRLRADALLSRRDVQEHLNAEERAELLERVQDEVLDKVDDWPGAAFNLAYEFSYDKGSVLNDTYRSYSLSFDDFPSCEGYTQRFNWCCCALAWAVAIYDSYKAAKADHTHTADTNGAETTHPA